MSILSWKFYLRKQFIKDDPEDLRDELTDDSSANQPVILQGHVGFSCCQVSQRYSKFETNFSGLPEIDN